MTYAPIIKHVTAPHAGWAVMGGVQNCQMWAWFAIDRKDEAEWYVAHLRHVEGTGIQRIPREPESEESHSTDSENVSDLPPEPTAYDMCCGNCGPGLCYVDKMTGA